MANYPANKSQRRCSCLLKLVLFILVGYATFYLHQNYKIAPVLDSSRPPKSSAGRVQIDLLHGLEKFSLSKTQCRVKRLNSTESASHTKPKPRCSPQIFREYFERFERFYGSGQWMNAQSLESARFEPDDCIFSESFPEAHSLRDHIRINNVTNILVSGASNGKLFAGGVLKVIKKALPDCQRVRSEENRIKESEFRYNVSYFQVPAVPVSIMHGDSRGCKHCRAYQYHCSHGNLSVNLEYISLTRFVDSAVRLNYGLGEPYERYPPFRFGSSTMVEYLLKYYFKHWGYPDIWLVYAPIIHEILDRDLRTFAIYMEVFRQLVNLYMPATSRTAIVTPHLECYTNATTNLLLNIKIHNMTQVLFNVLRPDLLNPDSKILGFLDLVSLSCPVMCDWHQVNIGAHMAEEWYDKIASYMIEFVLNEKRHLMP